MSCNYKENNAYIKRDICITNNLDVIKILVEEGLVISTNSSKNESMSFLDEEWKETLLKLTDNRRRLSNEDEEMIKTIANKL